VNVVAKSVLILTQFGHMICIVPVEQSEVELVGASAACSLAAALRCGCRVPW
jgi:hypothetical protein